jgi:predicted nuclease of predicted toxin-antitoxin system
MADRIRLYLDEDAQRASLVRALRARKVEVTTALEAGKIGATDEEQLAYAVAQNLTLFSFNRGDFVQLHTEYLRDGHPHAGIIVSDQLEVGLILRRLLRLLDRRSAEEMNSWLEFLRN